MSYSLMRWIPRSDYLSRLEEEFNNHFNSVFSEFFLEARPDRLSKRSYPKIDILQKDNDLIIQAAVPGMKKEDILIDIKLDKERENTHILTLTGNRQEETKQLEDKFAVRELRRSSFSRQILLSDEVINKCSVPEAHMEDGILTIKFTDIYKPEPEVEPKQIPIK